MQRTAAERAAAQRAAAERAVGGKGRPRGADLLSRYADARDMFSSWYD